MSIYDLSRNPCQAFGAAADGVPGPFPWFPHIPSDRYAVPEPPQATYSPVPLGNIITINQLHMLAQPPKDFWRQLLAPVVKHY